jgi:hypothetical protein
MTESHIAAPPPVPPAQPAQPAPDAPPAAPRSRSVFVTVSGVVVAILPVALVAAALVAMPDTAPGRSVLARGDVGEIVRTFFYLVVLAPLTLAGIAIARRWIGWRYYAGTLGWLFVVMACFLVNEYFESLDWEPYFAPASNPRAMVEFAGALAMLGIFLLSAKRDEPPARPARPMTGVGIAVIVLGLAISAGAFSTMMHIPDPAAADLLVVVAIGGLIALAGYGIARRARGWRIYAGIFAWILIVVGVLGGLSQIPASYAPRYASRLWMHAMTVAMIVGFGWLILWSKRREPRPAPKPKDAAAA